jgi:hypothetical protein
MIISAHAKFYVHSLVNMFHEHNFFCTFLYFFYFFFLITATCSMSPRRHGHHRVNLMKFVELDL